MRLSLRPYQLLLLLVASASLLSLWKINKRSFYFHYFKVIEEVEGRNSQAVSDIIYYATESTASRKSQLLGFLAFCLGFTFLWTLVIRLQPETHSRKEIAPIRLQLMPRLIPVRAP